jgi:hypothetical protein
VDAKIIGTTEHLAAQAVLNRPDVLLTISCRWFDDCSFDYDGLQQRADGASFLVRILATAGITYKFLTTLQSGSGTHLRLAIYQPDSIGTAATDSTPAAPGTRSGKNCKNTPTGGGGAADDVAEITLGVFGGPADGRQAWGALHGCEDATRVGPDDRPCDGPYVHFPGQVAAGKGVIPIPRRKAPSWPSSWANFSFFKLYSHGSAWANLHRLGQPDTFLTSTAL